MPESPPKVVPDDLLELLACPRCRGALEARPGEARPLACLGCGATYPVEDGIPVLLPPPEGDGRGPGARKPRDE